MWGEVGVRNAYVELRTKVLRNKKHSLHKQTALLKIKPLPFHNRLQMQMR